jgi:hypothetical protein
MIFYIPYSYVLIVSYSQILISDAFVASHVFTSFKVAGNNSVVVIEYD